MSPGTRVLVEYPGHACHKRIGTITGQWTDDFLGELYVVECGGDFAPISFPASNLRTIAEEAA